MQEPLNFTYEIVGLKKDYVYENLDVPVNANYEWYVNQSKMILKSLVVQQAVIGFYAVKVCTIRHGGITNGYYTLTQFAKDLGINPKTLNDWTAIYRRVIAQLDIDPFKLTAKEWRTARRIAYQLETEKTDLNKSINKPRNKSIVQRDRESIKKLWEENLEGPSVKYELSEWKQRLRTLYNNLQKRDLKLANPRDLIELMENADLISDLINDFLSHKK